MDKNVYVEIGKITNTAKHVKKLLAWKWLLVEPVWRILIMEAIVFETHMFP